MTEAVIDFIEAVEQMGVQLGQEMFSKRMSGSSDDRVDINPVVDTLVRVYGMDRDQTYSMLREETEFYAKKFHQDQINSYKG